MTNSAATHALVTMSAVLVFGGIALMYIGAFARRLARLARWTTITGFLTMAMALALDRDWLAAVFFAALPVTWPGVWPTSRLKNGPPW